MNGDACDNPDCVALRQRASEEIIGLMATVRSQASTIGNARRREQDFRKHDQYDRCVRLFRVWQRATGHTRSHFTADRFKRALPFLLEYEDTMIGRASEGLAFDPYTTRRANGTTQRHDSWELLFKSADRLEEFANRAPLAWKETLAEHAAEVEGQI